MEEWKELEGTRGLLEVSSEGRIRSRMRDGRILKQQIDKKGYCRVAVTILRERKYFKVHRAVASAFVPNPLALPQVNHIDGNKQNNRADNLEWVTNIQNSHHAMENGLWRNVFAASAKTNDARKTPIISIDCLTGERMRFESVSSAERFFGSRHISDVLNGKREKAAGHRFYREEVI